MKRKRTVIVGEMGLTDYSGGGRPEGDIKDNPILHYLYFLGEKPMAT